MSMQVARTSKPATPLKDGPGTSSLGSMDAATPELETVHEVTEPDVTEVETESDFTRATETSSMIVQEGSAALVSTTAVESMAVDADLSLNRSLNKSTKQPA